MTNATGYSDHDLDILRSMSGLEKNEGLWKSTGQAAYARRNFQTRINSYVDDSGNQVEPEYLDGSRDGITLAPGQIYVRVSGAISFEATHSEYQGRFGNGRPLGKGYVLDGVGLVASYKFHFRQMGHHAWEVNQAKTETLFTRTVTGPDLWAVSDAELAARKDAEAARLLAASPAPTGRVTVTGEVVGLKEVENRFGYHAGTTLKMIVLTTDGWKLYCTVPSSMNPARGDTVTIKVTVEPSKDDPKFAFGKRPTAV